VYGAIKPIFSPAPGSAAWLRQNPELAADVLAAARLTGRRDREIVHEALGSLPPSYPVVDEAASERYVAAARVAGGDRSRVALAAFADADADLTAREGRARRAWALDQAWKPGAERRPEWREDFLKLHPEYVRALTAPREEYAPPVGPIFPSAVDDETVVDRRRPPTLPDSKSDDGASPLLRINPNTAPPQVIGTLPKFGPTLTKAAVDARREALFRLADTALRPHLRFPADSTSDRRSADWVFNDVLSGRPPRFIGPLSVEGDGPPRGVPGVSSRETPMKPIDPADIRYDRELHDAELRRASAVELRKILGEHFRRVVAPAAGPGPGASPGDWPVAREIPDWRSDANGLLSDRDGRFSLSDALPMVASSRPIFGFASGAERPAESARRAGGGIGDQVAQDLAAAAKDLREAVREFRQGVGQPVSVGQPGPRSGGLGAALPGIPPALPGRM